MKQLVFSHIVPVVPNCYFYSAFLGEAADHYDGPILIGEDSILFSLPANTDVIIYDQLLKSWM